MKIGYARAPILNVEADFEAQLGELNKAGCEKVFTDRGSFASLRPQLAAALDFIGTGDSLVVTRLDRLARSTEHLVQIADGLEARGATMQILDLGVDTGTSAGRHLLTMAAAIARFEREIALEHRQEGVTKAKAEGRYKGRKPTARAKSKDVLRLKDKGAGATEISRTLDIGRASVYRIINDRKAGRLDDRVRHAALHPMQKEIDVWAARATFASQKDSGYKGYVNKSFELAAVQEFVMQYLAKTGGFPKKAHAVPKLEKYGSRKEFTARFPD